MGHTTIDLEALRGQSVNKTPHDRAYDTPLRASQGKTFISHQEINRINSKEFRGRYMYPSSPVLLGAGITFLGDPYQDVTTSSACHRN